MRIGQVQISNFRSIENIKLNMEDYVVLFGPNNSGKSNIIRALLFYFDYLRPTTDMFHRNGETCASELWVEVQYIPDNPKELDDLPDKYKLSDGTYIVRKVVSLNNLKSKYHGYIETDGKRSLDQTEFFGAKNVSKTKLGELIYIPALKDVGDETKPRGSTILAKLLKNIVSDSLQNSAEYNELKTTIKRLSESLQGAAQEKREERDYSIIANVKKTLEEELQGWRCGIDISLQAPDPLSLIQQSSTVQVIEKGFGPTTPESMGHGFQRALLIAFIKTWAEIERRKLAKAKKDKKVYKPELTLLLFEEPEIYLAPPRQRALFNDLESLSENNNTQVLLSTHSSSFLAAAEENLQCLVKVLREDSTKIYQVSDEFINKLTEDEVKQRFRFQLWLNAERNEAFFSDRVVLVEGTTEKAIYQWLLSKNKDKVRSKAITIIDCGLKTNIPYFIKLFSDLHIHHYVVHDDDNNKSQFHIDANKAIQDAKTAQTIGIWIIPGDMENYLGLPKRPGYRKPLEALYFLEESGLPSEKEDNLMQAVTGVL